jgi:FKBP12-rapamycin complex-associated protein
MSINKEIKLTFLDLIAFLNKEKTPRSDEVQAAAARCALNSFRGDLNEPLPAIVL